MKTTLREYIILSFIIIISIFLFSSNNVFGATYTIYQDLVPLYTSAGGVNDGFYFTTSENMTITQLKISNGSVINEIRLYDSLNNILQTELSNNGSEYYNVMWSIIANTQYHIHGQSPFGVTTYNTVNTGYPYGDAYFTFISADDGNYQSYSYTRLFEYITYVIGYIPPSNVTFFTPNCSLNYTYGDNGILFNWSQSYGSDLINYKLEYINDYTTGIIKDYDTQTTYNWTNTEIGNVLNGKGLYNFTINSYDNTTSVITSLNCSIEICFNNWKQALQSCQNDNTKHIYYYDENSCKHVYNLPLNNNTYEYCVISPSPISISNFDLSDSLYITILLWILILVSFYTATTSDGKIKGLYIITGICLIIFSFVLWDKYTTTSHFIYAIIYMSVPIVIDLIGLALIIIGFISMFTESD